MPNETAQEIKILEFQVDNALPDGNISKGYYGINVSKVQRIINIPETVVQIPSSHPAIMGIITLHNTTIPLIDLTKWLKRELPGTQPSKVIITEFSGILNGFAVHSVSRIHKTLWKDVEHPPELIGHENASITGIVRLKEKVILLLDFEKITADVNTELGFKTETIQDSDVKRADKHVLIVEDSAFIRRMLHDNLAKAGYKVSASADGREAISKLEGYLSTAGSTNQPISKFINLVITDLEMPQVDGKHLIKRIKEDATLKTVPVMVFSSLINKEYDPQIKELGADRIISKPDIKRLVSIADELVS